MLPKIKVLNRLTFGQLLKLATELKIKLPRKGLRKRFLLVLVKDAVRWYKAEDDRERRAKVEAARALRPPEKKWYVIVTSPRHERRVRKAIRKKVRKEGWGYLVGRIAIPVSEEMAYWTGKSTKFLKKGQRYIRREKRLPGYLLVHLSLTDDIIHVVKGTRYVLGFLPFGTKPTPVPSEEVKRLCTPSEGIRPRSKKGAPRYAVGNVIVVSKNSPFEGMEGKIKAVQGKAEEPSLVVELAILGNPTPVTLPWWQCKPIPNGGDK